LRHERSLHGDPAHPNTMQTLSRATLLCTNLPDDFFARTWK
jgi:hypothetical protein